MSSYGARSGRREENLVLGWEEQRSGDKSEAKGSATGQLWEDECGEVPRGIQVQNILPPDSSSR